VTKGAGNVLSLADSLEVSASRTGDITGLAHDGTGLWSSAETSRRYSMNCALCPTVIAMRMKPIGELKRTES
jgi:hypothetical protein